MAMLKSHVGMVLSILGLTIASAAVFGLSELLFTAGWWPLGWLARVVGWGLLLNAAFFGIVYVAGPVVAVASVLFLRRR